MSKRSNGYRIRIILGYRCRLEFDSDSECYLITCDKFPGVLEDGMDAKQATIRMRCNLKRVIREMKKEGRKIPPLDEPEWQKTLEFTGHFANQEKNNEKNEH
ncbi:MAG: hypothetical protein ACI4FX_03175 [Agathobacter sp.]